MCKNTMAALDYTSSEDVLDDSSDSFHNRLSQDDSDCCGDSGESLEDTLSLTCDDSLSSNAMEDSSDSEIVVYSSPDLLRRRLLPLAPSPISDEEYAATRIKPNSYHSRFEATRLLLRKPSSTRILGFTLSMMAYLFVTLVDFGSMVESIQVASLSKDAQQWHRFLRRRGPNILQKIPSRSTNPEYTIRIKGHRLDLISQSIDFHAQCPSVKSVQVEWTDQSSLQPKSLLNHKSGKMELLQKPKTPAVLLLDEDIILACDEIERAFREWRLNPSKLVGFYPYHHLDKQLAKASIRTPKPQFKLRPVSRGEGAYSILSDRAVFVHNLYLRNLPSVPHDCQHLGLSVVVSSITSEPPIAVMSNPTKAIRQSKIKLEIANDANHKCQQWIETLGSKIKLPEQVSTVVGH